MVSLRLIFAAVFALAALAGQADDTRPAPVMDKVPLQVVTTIGRTPEESRVLKLSVALEYASDGVAQRLLSHKARIQHHVILELSELSESEWNSTEVKLSLQSRLAENLNLLFDIAPEKGIQDVFFTEFRYPNSAV